jgi:nitrate reductase NapA
VRGLEGPDLLAQPGEEGQVLGESAEECLAEVDVRLDETGEGVEALQVPNLFAGAGPELPDLEWRGKPSAHVPKDKYPFWLLLGVVYEHFHTAKTIRGATTRRLVPEQYVEMHPSDAANYGIQDGDWVRITTRRGSFEARAQVNGARSKIRPARNNVMQGFIFSPWNLSVADSADPKENKWLVNAVSHRGWDPVSGQADFKKLAARIEKIERA